MRLLQKWHNPNEGRKVPPGVIHKLGANVYLFADKELSVRLLTWLNARYQKDTRLFKVVEEQTWKEIRDELRRFIRWDPDRIRQSREA
jgi:hypothetical protein